MGVTTNIYFNHKMNASQLWDSINEIQQDADLEAAILALDEFESSGNAKLKGLYKN